MFQTEPNLWLQAHGSPPLTVLLSAVTLLGYTPVYIGLLLVLAFAVRLRPSLGVLGGLLLCGLLTDAAKDGVAYPRPDEVDARIARTFATTPLPLHARGGATRFLGLPQPDAIVAVRRRAAGNYGFPSGHVAAATACLLCAARFFRSGRPLAFAAAWVPVMALSRMYLGRHFLADVLGGLAIGLVSSALAVLLFRPFDDDRYEGRRREARLALAPVTLVSLALLVLAPYQPLLRPEYVGALTGLLVAWAILLVTGLPLDEGTPRQRRLRVAVAALVFLAGVAAMEALLDIVGRQGARLVPLGTSLLVTVFTFAGTVTLCRRLGLYPEAQPGYARANAPAIQEE